MYTKKPVPNRYRFLIDCYELKQRFTSRPSYRPRRADRFHKDQ